MILGVITATLGASPHLDETVGSVSALSVRTRHVLVCPRAAAPGLARRYPKAVVLAEPAGAGLYGALNQARDAMAATDFVTWINDDDLLREDGVRAALQAFVVRPELAIAYGRVGLIDGQGASLGELPVARRGADIPALLGTGLMPLAQPGTIFRRRVLDELEWFDGGYRLAGDLDLFVRAARAGLSFGHVSARVADFRLHGGQLSKDEARAEAERRRALAGLSPRSSAFCAAVWRFRWDNRRVYLERLRLHGPRRMASLYRHV